jgi:hypothetical protein
MMKKAIELSRWYSKVAFLVGLICLLVFGSLLTQKVLTARSLKRTKVNEIRLVEQVALADVCCAVNKSVNPTSALTLRVSPEAANIVVSSFYHSESDANTVIWNIAGAFQCDVEIGGDREVLFFKRR